MANTDILPPERVERNLAISLLETIAGVALVGAGCCFLGNKIQEPKQLEFAKDVLPYISTVAGGTLAVVHGLFWHINTVCHYRDLHDQYKDQT